MSKVSFRNDVLPLKDALYRLALHITLDNAEAEDIVQDTLLKLWNCREQWNEIENETKEISISMHMLFATSVPVTIYKGNHLSQATEVVSHNVSDDKLNLVLLRKGNVSSRINLKVYDAKGNEIGHMGPVRIYTPNGKRNLTINLKSGTKPAKLELNDALTNKKLAEKAL